MITAGDWRVPLNLRGAERAAQEVVVVTGEPGREVLIADCRNRFLPHDQQRANAQLCARAPRMREALRRIERSVGDLPAGDKACAQLYAVVIDAMNYAGVSAAPDDD